MTLIDAVEHRCSFDGPNDEEVMILMGKGEELADIKIVSTKCKTDEYLVGEGIEEVWRVEFSGTRHVVGKAPERYKAVEFFYKVARPGMWGLGLVDNYVPDCDE
jgi:hypothetical protein